MKNVNLSRLIYQILLYLPSLLLLLMMMLILCSAEHSPSSYRLSRLDSIQQELIRQNYHEYSITTNSTVDSRNTLEVYHDGVAVYDMTRSLKIENTGNSAIHNPRVVVNGERNWSSVENILKEIVTPQMSEREKALAIWYFVRENRYHYLPAEEYGDEIHDPVIYLNVYGYGFCDDSARNLDLLWQAAGLKSRLWVLSGHVVSEVWFDGQYHMLDADTNAFYLLPDNTTIAGVEDLQKDPWLVKRTHHFGRFSEANETADQNMALLYGDDDFIIDSPEMMGRSIEMVLKPGESFEWRWDYQGKYHDIMYHEGEPPYYANGKFVYTPDLNDNLFRSYLEDESGIISHSEDGHGAKLHISPERADEDDTAYLIFKIESPYVIVGGGIVVEPVISQENDKVIVSISEDSQNWKKLWLARPKGAPVERISLDEWIAPLEKDAKYIYYLKLEFKSDQKSPQTGVNFLSIETDVQMAPLSLPALSAGMNSIEYFDDTQKPHQAYLTYRWVENQTSNPPLPPAEPVFPMDGSRVDSNQFQFEWATPVDPDGDAISACHILVSDDPEANIPVSPNFDRVIAGNQFDIPAGGLLKTDREYTWRVRCKDENDIWGNWSDVWKFTPSGPAAPEGVRIIGGNQLVWTNGVGGSAPEFYEIYASDRRGFIPSQEQHQEVEWGTTQNPVILDESNYLGRTTDLTYSIPMNFITRYRNNDLYFRVIAMDGKGNKSSPTLAVRFKMDE